MTATTATRRRPKSPAAPSRDLEDAIGAVAKLYQQFSHGTFSRAEIGSALKMSADSGPFTRKLYSIKEYGLIEEAGDRGFRVTDLYRQLSSNDRSSAEFKQAALTAIRGSEVFADVLNEASQKLPVAEVLAKRLETQKHFNAERAKEVANVLHESLRFAGILDGNNNILPVRADGQREQPRDEQAQDEMQPEERPAASRLRIDVALGAGRVATVQYPEDLNTREAKKISNVLQAVAAEPEAGDAS